MCYSETLTREAHGHYVEATQSWVLEGWKLVNGVGPLPSSLHEGHQEYDYELGKVLYDDHGFHLAATKRGALKASMQMVDQPEWDLCSHPGCNQSHWMTRAKQLRHKLATYMKVLVAEEAIENNHAHVMLCLPAGRTSVSAERLLAVAQGGGIWCGKRAAQRAELQAQIDHLRLGDTRTLYDQYLKAFPSLFQLTHKPKPSTRQLMSKSTDFQFTRPDPAFEALIDDTRATIIAGMKKALADSLTKPDPKLVLDPKTRMFPRGPVTGWDLVYGHSPLDYTALRALRSPYIKVTL